MNRRLQILVLMTIFAGCSGPEKARSESSETTESSTTPRRRPAAIDEATAELLRELAELHRQGKYGEGLARVESEMRRDPHRPRLHHNLGVFHASSGAYESAIEAFEEEIARYPDYPDSYRSLAIAYTRVGRLEDSIPYYERCLSETPDDALCALQLGQNLSTLGALQEAEGPLAQAAELRRDATTYAVLASLYRRRGDLDRAAATFSKALAEDPRHLATLVGFGQTLTALGRNEDGETLLERHRQLAALQDLLDLFERSKAQSQVTPQALLDLARLHLERHDREAAIDAYEQVLKLDVSHSFAALELADLYLAEDRLDQAERCVELAMAADRHNPAPHFFFGLLKLKMGDGEAAGQAFASSQRLGGWPAAAYRDLGSILRQTGDIEPATRAYREAIRLDPQDAPAHHGLALALDGQGDRDAALEAVRRAVEIEPGYGDAWILLGALSSVDDPAAADAAFLRALSAERLKLLEAGGSEALLRDFPGSANARRRLQHLLDRPPEI